MSPPQQNRPEVLAPAGDQAALEAAVQAGADAVYFGLQGFNARARATNFDAEGLAKTMRFLHERGVRGYVTLNTLVFDEELALVERAIMACAEAGVDAVIVQDLGVAKLVQAIAPSLPIHASTQMTCTDASSVELAKELGASRVILARELSLSDIEKVRAGTDVEVEVFVHGALCISYSGQCLTSEAIGGRSANRGACAQACRLPYELVVDGQKVDTEESAYLLSPEDLEASAIVADLVRLGVSSLKIEGRLKGPEYVAATTRLYRKAIDAALSGSDSGGGNASAAPTERERNDALQTFTRGSGLGFFPGVDHQRLVEGRSCDHRGLYVGTVAKVEQTQRKTLLHVKLAEGAEALSAGDGLLIEGGYASEGEVGGRIWTIDESGRIWFGPDLVLPSDIAVGRRIHKTSAPQVEKRIRSEISTAASRIAKPTLKLRISGNLNEPFTLEGEGQGRPAVCVTGDANIEAARSQPIDEKTLRDKLGRLGDSKWDLGSLEVALPPNVIIPLSSLNRARRALIEELGDPPTASVRHTITEKRHRDLLRDAVLPDRAPPKAGLFVLCRTLDQAHAAIEEGADGVYLDFLELTGTGDAVRALRSNASTTNSNKAFIGVAPPRIRKPGEEKIDRFIASLAPDALLVRGLGALRELSISSPAMAMAMAMAIGDFSLNVTNRITAAEVLSRGLACFTPSFDLDAAQLLALAKTPFGPWMEIVLHHPMALFHMEHCVIAALLSDGRDYKTCGRPCEKHRVSLRDRAGMEHPVEADVGCRNTVFHARPQSAVQLLPELARAGASRFRIELVRETPADVKRLVNAYRRAIREPQSATTIWRELRTDDGYGVVKGSLRVVTDRD